jgi:hypothetical protein
VIFYVNSVFDEYDGELLLELRNMQLNSPATYAVYIDHELGAGRLRPVDVLRLNKVLRQLL